MLRSDEADGIGTARASITNDERNDILLRPSPCPSSKTLLHQLSGASIRTGGQSGLEDACSQLLLSPSNASQAASAPRELSSASDGIDLERGFGDRTHQQTTNLLPELSSSDWGNRERSLEVQDSQALPMSSDSQLSNESRSVKRSDVLGNNLQDPTTQSSEVTLCDDSAMQRHASNFAWLGGRLPETPPRTPIQDPVTSCWTSPEAARGCQFVSSVPTLSHSELESGYCGKPGGDDKTSQRHGLQRLSKDVHMMGSIQDPSLDSRAQCHQQICSQISLPHSSTQPRDLSRHTSGYTTPIRDQLSPTLEDLTQVNGARGIADRGPTICPAGEIPSGDVEIAPKANAQKCGRSQACRWNRELHQLLVPSIHVDTRSKPNYFSSAARPAPIRTRELHPDDQPILISTKSTTMKAAPRLSDDICPAQDIAEDEGKLRCVHPGHGTSTDQTATSEAENLPFGQYFSRFAEISFCSSLLLF
ncbi:MAG: hypothetical protein M1837_006511 [Sclerophora amabilis]|nr:MAG: hypothetical protein M1837_006511 [Sclerophora amabilis]